MKIHNDPPEKLSQDSYRRFLIDSPIYVTLDLKNRENRCLSRFLGSLIMEVTTKNII